MSVRKYKFTSVGVETGTQPDAGTPTDDSDLIPKDYAESNFVGKDSDTGAANLPAGTTGQRPGSPSAGMFRYNSDTGQFEGYTNAWGEIAGGGSGGINYVDNPDAETNANDWTDTTNTTISRETTGDLIRGDGVFNVDITASATTSDYVETQFDLDPADANSVLGLSFEHIDGTNFDSGDVDVVLIKDPGGTEVEIVPSITELPSTGSSINNFVATWVSQAADTYALRFKVATASTAIDFRFDNVKVGPELTPRGVPFEDEKDRTPDFTIPSGSWGTATNSKILVSRQGQYAYIYGEFTAGTVSTGDAYIELPGDMTIDVSNVQTSGSGQQRRVGSYTLLEASTTNDLTNERQGAVFVTQSQTSRLYFTDQTSNTRHDARAVNAVWANNDGCAFFAKVPISQWAGSSVNLSVAKAEYAYVDTFTSSSSSDGSDAVFGPSGGALASLSGVVNHYIEWLTPPQATDIVKVQLRYNGIWYNAGDTTSVFDNSDSTGVRVIASGTSNITCVQFRQYSYGIVDWDAQADRWRVVKYPGVIQSATPNAVKWQLKELSSSLTSSDTDIADLKFENLIPGRTYRITLQASMTLAGGGNNQGKVWMEHNAAKLCEVMCRGNSSASNIAQTAGTSKIFTAVTTTLITEFNETAASITLAAGGADGTWALLEELPTHVETSEW